MNPVSATRTHQEKTTQVFGNTIYRVKSTAKHNRETVPPDKRGESEEASSSSGRTNGTDNCQHSSQRDGSAQTNGNLYTRQLTPYPGNEDQTSHTNSQTQGQPLTYDIRQVAKQHEAEGQE